MSKRWWPLRGSLGLPGHLPKKEEGYLQKTDVTKWQKHQPGSSFLSPPKAGLLPRHATGWQTRMGMFLPKKSRWLFHRSVGKLWGVPACQRQVINTLGGQSWQYQAPACSCGRCEWFTLTKHLSLPDQRVAIPKIHDHKEHTDII